jgi:hypothetical protein
MSEALHPVKLLWSSTRGGVARWYDVAVSLPAGRPPRIPISPAMSLEMIEWVPSQGVAHLRETTAPGREMTQQEIEACKRYVQLVCDPTHSAPEARLP